VVQMPKITLKPGCLGWVCNCGIPGGVVITLYPTDDGQEGTCKFCGTVYVGVKEATA